LDSGCGLGFDLSILERVSESTIVGLEHDRARLRTLQPATGQVSQVEGDATTLPFADGTFHKVLMSEVLEHLLNDEQALAESRRVLKPGGTLVVTVPHAGYPFGWDPLNWVRGRMGLGHFSLRPWSGIWTDHQRLYEPEELARKLQDCGFQDVETRLFTRWSFPFSHLLVYEAGRSRLWQAGRDTGRRQALWGKGPDSCALRWAIRLFTAPDRLNQAYGYSRGPAVSLCVRAVR
jgi:ubiquinone/menaquinone biosynthesis C-methylase UbiE